MFDRIKQIKEIPTRAFVRMQTASLPVKPETKSARAITQVVPHTSKDRAAVAFGAGLAAVIYAFTTQAFAAATATKKYTGLAELVNNVSNFALFLLIVLSVLMAVAAGLMFVTSGGNSKVINRAKDTIKYVVIGLVLVLVIGVGKDVLVDLVNGATGSKKNTSNTVSKGVDGATGGLK